MSNIRKPIRVLFVSHSSALLGAERSLLLLLRNIDRDRFEPLAVLPGSGPLKKEIENLSIKTYEVKYPWWVGGRRNVSWTILQFAHCIIREILALPKLYKIIKHEQIHVVYTNTIAIFSGAASAFLARTPHIWHIREIIADNPDLHFFFANKLLFRFISGCSGVIIANSNATAAQFEESESTQKIKVVYNAVDPEEFKVSTPFPRIAGVNRQDWLVTVVGSLQRRKAQDDAIRAVKIAKEAIPNIKLLLIGSGDKHFIRYLKQMVSELNLSDKVIFTGYRHDVPQILAQCEALLVPSWEEPFGRTTIEAMAAGTPVIGANSGGTKEIIEEGVTGYLVSPQNPLEIAEKMIELHKHPELARKIGDNGRRTAKEKFAPWLYVRSVEDTIMGIISRC